MGPNILPMEAVPNCWAKKRTTKIPNTIYTIVEWVISLKKGICFRPSIADVTDIGGVIIPSANNEAPPIIAGKYQPFSLPANQGI